MSTSFPADPAVATSPPAILLPELRLLPIAALRAGLFVELDLGWLAHPFPTNRFRLRGDDQIATLRSLGLTQVKVRLDLSDPRAVALLRPGVGMASEAAATSAAAAGTVTAAPVQARPGESGQAARGEAAGLSTASQRAASTSASPEAAPPPSGASPGPAARSATLTPLPSAPLQRAMQHVQRCAEAHSERLHQQALAQWQTLAREAVVHPTQSAQTAARYAQELVDRLAADPDATLRVLHLAQLPPVATHSVNVSMISLLLARRMGADLAEQRQVALGAFVHDLGKLATMRRQGGSSAGATEDHVLQGLQLGRRMGLPQPVLDVIAQHHERHDGSGLPARLAGLAICRAARIVALVDDYDRLCNPPEGQTACTPHEAQALLYARTRSRTQAGSSQPGDPAAAAAGSSHSPFDPEVLTAFVRLMGVYPPGSLVQLSNERHALVVAAHAERPLEPLVQLYLPGRSREDCPVLPLQGSGLTIKRSLRPEQLPAAALACLAPGTRLGWSYTQGFGNPTAQREAA
ncbi:MAG: hypothetical protein RL722_1051 [Pseudomonadota bacterium]|jgi:putative nucleotidyltransferase with HDIG domain